MIREAAPPWSRRGNNIVDRLADIIDQEVYQLWLAESKRKNQNRRYSETGSASPGASPGSSPGSGRYEAMQDYHDAGYDSQRGSMTSSMGHSPAQQGYGPPPQHSEYGPGPYQQAGAGYSNNFQSSYSSAPPAYSSQPPAYSQYGGSMANDPRSTAHLHDPFAQPRAGAMPPPPPPPAPGRGAPPGYPGGGFGAPTPQDRLVVWELGRGILLLQCRSLSVFFSAIPRPLLSEPSPFTRRLSGRFLPTTGRSMDRSIVRSVDRSIDRQIDG
eukprot:s361_g6.t2